MVANYRVCKIIDTETELWKRFKLKLPKIGVSPVLDFEVRTKVVKQTLAKNLSKGNLYAPKNCSTADLTPMI